MIFRFSMIFSFFINFSIFSHFSDKFFHFFNKKDCRAYLWFWFISKNLCDRAGPF